jgi:peptidoglycan/LPS O-acetylase OafA/YrhL
MEGPTAYFYRHALQVPFDYEDFMTRLVGVFVLIGCMMALLIYFFEFSTYIRGGRAVISIQGLLFLPFLLVGVVGAIGAFWKWRHARTMLVICLVCVTIFGLYVVYVASVSHNPAQMRNVLSIPFGAVVLILLLFKDEIIHFMFRK